MAKTTLVAFALFLAAFGCKSGDFYPESSPIPPERPTPPAAPPERKEKRLVVFAAASLREAFTALGDEFEKAHAGVEVTFNFAGSQELRTQLEHGAAADVFASADAQHMLELVAAGHVVYPSTFARNQPVMVVATEQRSKLRAFGDLSAARRIVIGTPDVPIGRYTLRVLDRATAKLGPKFREDVEANVVSRELNVRQVLAKVTLGEADAAIVYRTDAATAKNVGIVEIPPAINLTADYPIAVVAHAPHPTLAHAWVELVRGPAGRAALMAAGFLRP